MHRQLSLSLPAFLLMFVTCLLVSPTTPVSAQTKPQGAQKKNAPRKKGQRKAKKKKPIARPQPSRKVVYKQVGKVKLSLHIFEPKEKATQPRAAIVFFFGGGWVGGNPSQFYPHCDRLAKLGMVAISAQYRIRSQHKTTPYECVKDGKSAIRWVREHAKELGVDPNRIAAGGGSAGGHVAAATATVNGFEEEGEDTKVSARPNALVLFNPVYDNGPKGYGYERVKERYQEFSPMHNIRKGMAPAIVFLGTKDKLIPVATAESFKKKMEAVGSKSQLEIYQGQGHGFFNFGRGDGKIYEDTVKKMIDFLRGNGFVS